MDVRCARRSLGIASVHIVPDPYVIAMCLICTLTSYQVGFETPPRLTIGFDRQESL